MKLEFAVIEHLKSTLEFKEKEGQSDLKILQQEVGGDLERLTRFFPWAKVTGIEVFGNEEAALRGLEPSCLVWQLDSQKPVALLRGPLVFVRLDEKGEYFKSLNEDDRALIENLFYCYTNDSRPEELDGLFIQFI